MQTAPAPAGIRYRVAGFWRRTLASLVDGVVLFPLAALFAGATSAIAGQPLPRFAEIGFAHAVRLAVDGGLAGQVALAIAGLVCFLYLLIFYATSGQTPGMRVLHMRVIDPYGGAPSVLRSLARIFALILSLSLASLGWLWIGFSREKRGLHDILAGTWVVLADPVSAPQPVRALGAPSP